MYVLSRYFHSWELNMSTNSTKKLTDFEIMQMLDRMSILAKEIGRLALKARTAHEAKLQEQEKQAA